MNLTIGQRVRAAGFETDLVVGQLLGEGGQGSVYLAESKRGLHALKWYNPDQSTPEQQAAIRYLVQTGPPRGLAGKRFVWPEALVVAPQSRQFGYLMPRIDTQRYAELSEVWAHRKPAPGLSALCEISYQAANSYRSLHLSGHCYRDISRGNLMFDPRTGGVLICDNDNVGVNRQSRCQVWGTLEYMAPELVRGAALPSTETDLHSLAVLLFNLWIWHHPLHGLLEYQFHSWDLTAKVHVYGKSPVFVFDPTDKRNQLPNDPDYATARQRWGWCPPSLQVMFLRAFTNGLHEPAQRVTEGEWQSLFLQLKDSMLRCPGCRADNLWDPGRPTTSCWHCRQLLSLPPRLLISHAAGKQCILLDKGAKVLRRHVNPAATESEAGTELGEVVQHPSEPHIWGIKNLTGGSWNASLPDGTTRQYAPQKAVPLNAGIKLLLEGACAEIDP